MQYCLAKGRVFYAQKRDESMGVDRDRNRCCDHTLHRPSKVILVVRSCRHTDLRRDLAYSLLLKGEKA